MKTSSKSLRTWFWIHEWTSLICTVFIVLACVTGLPLIFHAEIDAFFASPDTAATNAGTELDFDALIAAAQASEPAMAPQFIFRDAQDPGATLIGLGQTVDAPLEDGTMMRVSNTTGAVLEAGGAFDGFMGKMTQLHIELFAGQLGTFFLGLMTVLLLLAIISGVVLYAPFMGNRAFATVRDGDVRRRWFDLHNSLGMVLAIWLFVVSITGAINTIGSPLIQMWLMTDMNAQVASDLEAPLPENGEFASFQAAYEESLRQLPETDFYFAMFPNTGYSSDRHYLIFNIGRDALSSRLFKPVIINAYSGEYLGAPELPIYLKTLLLSQPLHFGNYGGIWLKIAWAVLDIGAIILLWSGLVLWWKRRRIRGLTFEKNAAALAN